MPRWLATVLLVVWLLPIVLPHAATDDDLCFPSDLGTGTAGIKAQIGAEKPSHHCVICHSLRSFRALTDCGPAATIVTDERVVAADGPRCPLAAALEHLPARAPPALL